MSKLNLVYLKGGKGGSSEQELNWVIGGGKVGFLGI